MRKNKVYKLKKGHRTTCCCCREKISDKFYVHQESNYCYSCLKKNNLFVCDSCSSVKTTKNRQVIGQLSICGKCYRDKLNETVRDYYYKPTTKFFGKDFRYFGIELEVAYIKDCNDYSMELNEKAFQLDHYIKEWAYLKYDGSIENCGYEGFEIVTHALTLPWIKKELYDKFQYIWDLSQDNFRSFSVKSCGMHVHVNKSSVSSQCLFNLLRLFKSDPEFLRIIGSRRKSEMSRWSPVCNNDDEYLNRIAKSKRDDFRGAINLYHDKTVEFRLFRGTLNPKGFMKNIEFVQSILEFCDYNKLSALCNFENYVEFLKERKEFYPLILDFIERKIREGKIFKKKKE